MGKQFWCKFYQNMEHYQLSKTRGEDMIYEHGNEKYKDEETEKKYSKYIWDDHSWYDEHYLNCDLFEPTEGEIMTFSEVKEEIKKCVDEQKYRKQVILAMILHEMFMASEDDDGSTPTEEKTIFWYSYS